MKIRNGNYTLYKNHEVELLEARQENPIQFTHFILKWAEAVSCPFGEFIKNEHGSTILLLPKEKVGNAFSVRTRAVYGGKEFEVEPYDTDKIHLHLATKDLELGRQWEFVELHDSKGNPYFLGEVNINEVEKIWEERKRSLYELPIPDNLELFKQIR